MIVKGFSYSPLRCSWHLILFNNYESALLFEKGLRLIHGDWQGFPTHLSATREILFNNYESALLFEKGLHLIHGDWQGFSTHLSAACDILFNNYESALLESHSTPTEKFHLNTEQTSISNSALYFQKFRSIFFWWCLMMIFFY